MLKLNGAVNWFDATNKLYTKLTIKIGKTSIGVYGIDEGSNFAKIGIVPKPNRRPQYLTFKFYRNNDEGNLYTINKPNSDNAGYITQGDIREYLLKCGLKPGVQYVLEETDSPNVFGLNFDRPTIANKED